MDGQLSLLIKEEKKHCHNDIFVEVSTQPS